jgi:hypothetical protein
MYLSNYKNHNILIWVLVMKHSRLTGTRLQSHPL